MKKIILNLFVFSLVCLSTNALGQTVPTRKTTPSKEKRVTNKEKITPKSSTIRMERSADQAGQMEQIDGPVNTNQGNVEERRPDMVSASYSKIVNLQDRVDYPKGFLVQGKAGSNMDIEVYNKVRWKQKGYSAVRSKEYDPVKVTSENNGSWKAKVERPYRVIPESAYDIRFEISSKQFPYDRLAPSPDPSIVRGTMAPPKIKRLENDVRLPRTSGPGGMYTKEYATVSGEGIPDLDIEVSVGTEYQTPKQRYTTGSDYLITGTREGETKSTKIASDGTWTIELEVPNPHAIPMGYSKSNLKLVVTAKQSSSSQDVSAEGKNKFDIK